MMNNRLTPLYLIGALALAGCGAAAPLASTAPSQPGAPASAAASKPAASAASAAAASKPAAATSSPAAAAKPSASASASGAKDKLTTAYSTQSSTSTVPFVTTGGNFWAKYNLDVTLNFTSPPALTASLTSGKDVPVAYASSASVVTIDAQGGDLVMIGAPVQGGIFTMVGGKGITSIADLKGKALAFSTVGGTGDLLARQVLTQNKLTPQTDVSMLAIPDFPTMIASLNSSQIAAGVMSEPFTSVAIEGGATVLYDQAKEGGKPIQSPITTKRSYLAANRDILKRFLMANMDAVHLMKTDPAQAAKYTQPYLKLDDLQALQHSLENYNKITDNNLDIPLSDLADSMKIAAGTVPEVAKLKPEDVVDLSLIQEITASGFLDKLYAK